MTYRSYAHSATSLGGASTTCKPAANSHSSWSNTQGEWPPNGHTEDLRCLPSAPSGVFSFSGGVSIGSLSSASRCGYSRLWYLTGGSARLSRTQHLGRKFRPSRGPISGFYSRHTRGIRKVQRAGIVVTSAAESHGEAVSMPRAVHTASGAQRGAGGPCARKRCPTNRGCSGKNEECCLIESPRHH